MRAGRFAAVVSLILIAADAPHPKGYVCDRANGPIAVDGKLDDRAWSRAPWTDDFVDIEGDARPRPRFRTRAKMLWDDRYLYIAAELEEPDVWGRLTAHDAVLFRDLDFEVFVDPDGDNHEYAELEINALGTTWDLFLARPYRDAGEARNSFEIEGLKSAVHVAGTLNKPGDKDEGWTVEIAMPWSSFAGFAHAPIPPRDGDQWRLNFSRVEWRHRVRGGEYEPIPKSEDNWVWSPQGRIAMHMPERWGYVQFSSAEPGTTPFRPDPTWPARARLMQVYEAQQAFRAETGRYARSLGKLGIAPGELAIVLT
ncbi:MAG TPA: carbohydrate-binding family 9-like protein, partial [Isosphaeraceae bacterium]